MNLDLDEIYMILAEINGFLDILSNVESEVNMKNLSLVASTYKSKMDDVINILSEQIK